MARIVEVAWLPLVSYWFVALIVPLLAGAAQTPRFARHCVCVVGVTVLLVALGTLVAWIARRVAKTREDVR